MTLEDALASVKKEVDEELAAFFDKKRREATQVSPHCQLLVDQVAAITTRGGKRTRAFLVWLGFCVFDSGNPTDSRNLPTPLLSSMMAIELFQSFALIHDDIMDEDTVRRGGPTVHEHFRIHALTHSRINSSTHSRIHASFAKHFGTSMAILAGDLALAWTDELMMKGKSEVIYQQMKQEMIFGQSLDILSSAGLPSAGRATINRYKTAWYSVIRPLQIGAALGGAGEEMVDALVPYGLAVGEGYQLRDDLLDAAIQEEVFEKKANTYQQQALQAVKSLTISKPLAILFGDFARFAMERQA